MRATRTSTSGVRGRRSSAHVEGLLELVRAGCYVFDYGNNLRGEAHDAGVADAFTYPGFVPAYIRPLFCRGVGPFRWAALSGDAADIEAIDVELEELFPDDILLRRWLELAPERVAFQGLPARICWLGYGDRARAGLAINELVRSGRVSAPVVIGRDHLDSGSVASPYRETEAMQDGSDAIADWPILNALLNVAAGATWVSVHHGGGVGIGNSIHAGMVVVADGTTAAAERLERVLTTDPGTGVMRHADAGYEEALDAARRGGIDLPSIAAPEHASVSLSGAAAPARLLIRDLAQVATPRGREGSSARCGSRCGGRPRRRLPALRARPHRSGGCDEGPEAARRRSRGARRAWALGDPGARRLPHACLLRGRSSRGVRAARVRSELRGAACGGRWHPRHGPRDARGR